MGPELVQEGREVSLATALNVEVDTVHNVSVRSNARSTETTYPSRTAEPKGRVLDEPPRKTFQMVSANFCAWESELKVGLAPPPPREIRAILPLFWQVWMADARKPQLGRSVPGKGAWFQSAQV